jgi:hypothetical protein
VIDAKPAVKIQSPSTSPGIAIVPRTVVEVPMPDDGSTGSGVAVHTELEIHTEHDQHANLLGFQTHV